MDSTLAWKKFANGQTPSSVTLNKIFYEKVSKNSQILDFGCAWGKVPLELQEKGYNVIGFDINEAEIKKAQEFAKESNKKYKSQIKFETANALNLPYKDNSFDSCLMQAFMTTLTNPEDRIKVLKEAKRVLKKDGILYMGVFGQTWENPKYQERYDAHFPITKEKGTFIVTKDGTPNTEEIYRVHHYTKDELNKLLSNKFKIELLEKTTFTSYHGNKANGFIVIAKK